MSNICGNELLQSVNDSVLMDIYSDGINPSILGSVTIGNGDRNSETGLLLPDRVSRIVANLQGKGVIPKAPAMTRAKNQAEILQKFMDLEADFIENVKSEYCFYNIRYRYSLNSLIKTLSEGFGSSSQENKSVVASKLDNSVKLNIKLNDITQILNEATRLRLKESQNHNDSINSLNEMLMTRSKKLNDENEVLTRKQDDAVLYKNMVKVTTEKANYTTNLLTMYSFLNILAIGSLFYVYRSME